MSRPETVELWRQRLQQFDPSSITVAQFCQLEGVSQAAFYKWKKTLRELSQQPSPRPIQPEVGFVPLRLSAVAENRVDVATDHAEHLPIAPPLASTQWPQVLRNCLCGTEFAQSIDFLPESQGLQLCRKLRVESISR